MQSDTMADDTPPIVQLIPFEKLQSALQRFCAAVELGCLMVGPKGGVMIEEDWHCFCKKDAATRQRPTFTSCLETENFFADSLPADQKVLINTCNNGFSCIGAPIIIEGQLVASIFVGLFLLAPPAPELLQTTAAAEGIEEPALLTAAAALPVFSPKKVQQLIAQLELTIDLLTELGRNVLLEQNVNRQIRKSEEHYRNLVNSLPQVIYETDLQGAVTFANPSAHEIFGYSPQELEEGLGLSQFIAEPDHQKLAARFKAVLSGQILEPEEYWFLRKDRSMFPGIVFSRPIYADGKVQGVRGVIIDNTHRKQAEERLRERESAWRAIFQHAPFGIAINRLCDGVYLDVNPAVERISGRQAAEVVGMTSYSFLPTSSHDASRKVMETIQQRGWTDNQETVIEKKDGTQAHLLYSSATFESGGECCAVSMLVDITERKAMEEKLQQSEATLQSFFQAAPVGLAILKGRVFQAVNDRLCEITGYLATDLLNQSSRHLYESQEEYHRVGASLYSRLQAQDTGYVETQFRHRDGSLRSVSLFAAPIDPVAPEAGVAVAIQDISDQKKMFQELRENEERFRTLFESASDAILITKDNSITGRTIVDCNMKALEMFGCARHEMLGRSPRYFSPALQTDGKTYLEKGATYVAEALKGVPQHFEWLHSRFDGTPFHADVSLNAIELSGEPYIQAIVRDVSKRKAIETALRESEFRFRSFFNTNPEGILLIDFQGKILDLNKAFLQESGYSLSDCIQKHFKEFIPPEDQTRIVEAILAIKSGLSQNAPLHFSYIAKDGAIVPVAAKGWPVVDENSNPLYMGIFIRNLTKELALAEEKNALERQVFQAQKSEAIGTLAGGIAHDFNNILGGIIGYTELALYRDPAAVPPKIREYLERVLEGGNRAKDLVQQILRFSKNSNVVMAPINLTPVIKESISLLRSTLPTTVSIQHQTEVASDRILGDSTQIHQVVMNLATNAYHAMRATGGLITIALKNVTLTQARQFMTMTIPPGEYLQLSVTDTGSGIPPAVLERIFEPYFTTKNVNEGTGLGMAVVKGIVKSHKGLIEIATVLGKGTCFDVFLPLTQGMAAEIDCQENHLSLGHGERVLIVDDETFFLEVIEKCLTLLGYQVFASHSSLTTLKTFRDNPQGYDLLITDQTMPEMTGVQLTQEIRKISSTLPVILCTGYSETVTEHSAHYYGVTEFLMKPVNIHDLAQTIAAVLAKRNAA